MSTEYSLSDSRIVAAACVADRDMSGWWVYWLVPPSAGAYICFIGVLPEGVSLNDRGPHHL